MSRRNISIEEPEEINLVTKKSEIKTKPVITQQPIKYHKTTPVYATTSESNDLFGVSDETCLAILLYLLGVLFCPCSIIAYIALKKQKSFSNQLFAYLSLLNCCCVTIIIIILFILVFVFGISLTSLIPENIKIAITK